MPALLMGNTLFGGSSNSKLFLNVREKLSLCYYASSLYHRQKGLITVSSGIEFQNYQKAYDEIMAPAGGRPEGQLEDWELEGARSTLLNAYATMGDSQGKLENFYLGQAATGQSETPEDLAQAVSGCDGGADLPRHGDGALDTVYFLKGKGGEAMKQIFYERIGESVYRETLPNGLQVCVVPKPGYAKKYAFFATRYGGMDTRFRLDGKWLDTPAGIAHYLEHKMFDTKEGNALQELAKNGAEPNAFTANAMTGYYFDSTEHFEENLQILLSFVSIPYFTDESVAKEQGIIGQEIRMIEDNPDWQIYTRMMQALYQNSTARTSIAGTVESISHITAETLYDCHKAFYTPSNMILTVVGDVDPIHVADLAPGCCPGSRRTVIPRDYGRSRTGVAEKETAWPWRSPRPSSSRASSAPRGGGGGYLRMPPSGDMACDILLGDSSPLYLRLYDQGLINTSFGGAFEMMPGVAYLYAGGDSKDARRRGGEILKEAARLAAEGIDEDFYQRVRRASFGENLRGLNSFENIAVTLTEGLFPRLRSLPVPPGV